MPLLVSSNWLAWLLSLSAFGLTELLLFLTTPRGQRIKRFNLNFLIGVAVAVFVYSILFTWSTLQTVYDDHRDSTGRWRVVVNEKNNLKAGLRQRDEYITKLEGKTCPLCKPVTGRVAAQVQVPPRCWADSVMEDTRLNRIDGIKSTTTVIAHCNYRVEAPFEFSVAFDTDELQCGAFQVPSIGGVMATGPAKNGKMCSGSVISPSLPANNLILMRGYGTKDATTWPKLLQIRIRPLG
jgi:hypothetical protein